MGVLVDRPDGTTFVYHPPVVPPAPQTTPAASTQAPAPTNATPASSTTPAAQAPSPGTGFLTSGTTLKPGQSIRSPNGQYELIMQTDGNLVLHDLANDKALWSSNTAGKGAQSATMQADGNLVVLKGDQAVWSSNTGGKPGSFLKLQDDGNAVVYTPNPNGGPSVPAANWSSGTNALPVDAPNNAPPSALPPVTSPTAGLFQPGLPPVGEQQVDGQGKPVLDQHRQDLATQENQLVDQINKETDPAKQATLRQQLSGVFYQELDYAGSQESVPDPNQLATTIASHKPELDPQAQQRLNFIKAHDPDARLAPDEFNDALATAKASYNADLQKQGRTADQIGKISDAAKSGNWQQVTDLTKQQLTDFAKNDEGTAALGDVSARGSVYLTYAGGGDPKFIKAVQDGIQQAQQYVGVDKPIQEVQDAYTKGGLGDAAKALDEKTDPQTTTPDQVRLIMSDPRVQSLIKDGLGKVDWKDPKSNAVITHLSAACQHAIESDQGNPGAGKKAADQIADTLLAQSDVKSDPTSNAYTFADYASPGVGGAPSRLFDALSLATAHGNVGLSLALASQAGATNHPDLQKTAIDAARTGLDGYAHGVSDLNKQTDADEQFLKDAIHNFGGDSTQDQLLQHIKTVIDKDPDDAKKLNDDGLKVIQEADQVNSLKMAVAAYSPDLNGVQGFNQDGKTDIPGLGVKMPSVVQALGSVPTIMGPMGSGDSGPGNTPPTSTLWLQRSTRNLVYTSAQALFEDNPDNVPDKLLNKVATMGEDGKATLKPFVQKANKILSAGLFFENSAWVSKSWNGGILTRNFLENGSYALMHGAMGTSHAMQGTLPESALRPGSDNTLFAKALDNALGSLKDSDKGDLTKKLFGGALGAVAKDGSDAIYLPFDTYNAYDSFFQQQGPGHDLHGAGMTLSALGDAAFLTNSGMDALAGAGIIGTDATFLGVGMGAVGWTGIGAVVMLAGAGIYTIGSEESNSHAFDASNKDFLIGMGVHENIAEQLAKHKFGGDSAGPSMMDYMKYGKLSEQDAVKWLNTLTPDQADHFATALKDAVNVWGDTDADHKAADVNQYLKDQGIKPPFDVASNSKPDQLNPLEPWRYDTGIILPS
ncbi:hypothetical protein [Trinickia fusca]|nr:hypothetical protein [Trinickia fusca]